jgi:predicted small metal-binding protein
MRDDPGEPPGMAGEPLVVRCACGWQISGPEADVVAATIEHGLRVHNMAATRDEVLKMAVRDAPRPR